MSRSIFRLVSFAATWCSLTSPAATQSTPRVEISPSSVSMDVGDTVRVSARVVAGDGTTVEPQSLSYSSSAYRSLVVDQSGEAIAAAPGQYALSVLALVDGKLLREQIPVTIRFPRLTRVDIAAQGTVLYVGATVGHDARVIDAAGTHRSDVRLRWETSDPAVASVDDFGTLSAHSPGTVLLRARADAAVGQHRYRIEANPVRSLELSSSADSARTGDVVRFTAIARDAQGRAVPDATVAYSVVAAKGVPSRFRHVSERFRLQEDESAVIPRVPQGQIDEQGLFVAERPGRYTVLAFTAGAMAQRTISVGERNVSRRVEIVGRGPVRDVPTSDLWVWEGVDGRDYAVTGTHSANGAAYFWDVTDVTHPELIDSVVVDARTVNDVKISEDARTAVISREGASNRVNGIVVLDVSDPRNVQPLSTFDDQLTGGVHNVFIHDNHVYAVNNLRRLDVINIADPRAPHRVGIFEIDSPDRTLHDVWVVDGIAFVSYLFDGVILVDVGNGIAGGSPSHPVQFSQYKYPVDIRGEVAFAVPTHAAFPYRSPTGKFYVFIGDESFRERAPGAPLEATGYFHVVDFTDLKRPEEVAWYEVPEAGAHNLWVEGDTLYAAFYNGGLRVLDISGELRGDLYAQGREIAKFLPMDPEGVIANAPNTWGPQPFKGHIFVADRNSGLWTVKLRAAAEAVP